MEGACRRVQCAFSLCLITRDLTPPAVVRVALHAQAPVLKNETCHVYGPKVKAALAAWDERRGPWDVVFCSHALPAPPDSTVKHVKPMIRTLQNVHIAKPELRPRPKESSAAEKWDEEVTELFEWVGLACLGSERCASHQFTRADAELTPRLARLRVCDRPDPYIAVYTPPTPNYTGSLLHARWTGLLSPQFVQSVLDFAR